MTIGFLVNHMEQHGGIEKIISQKINAWIDLYNCKVILITKLQTQENFIYPINQNCKHVNLNIRYELNGKSKYLKNILAYRNFYQSIHKILKEESIDILFTTLTGIDSLLVPLTHKKTAKVLEMHHSGHYLHKKTWKYKKYFIKKYASVVVLNEDEKKYYGLDNVAVIPNFIEDFRNKQNIQKQKIVISAGRIDPIKQFDHLIMAWSLIAKDFKDWKVHIYGNGDEQLLTFLQNLIKQKKLQENIEIFPATSDFLLKLQESSIFAQVSESECFPMVLLEAMQAGVPVIAYDCPNGPRNIISTNVDGILVQKNQIEKFAEKLKTLILDTNLQNKIAQNKEIKIEKFSRKRVMEQWKNLAEKLING